MRTSAAAFALVLLAAAAATPALALEEDAFLTCPELIAKYGYPVEQHEIETEDGYLLTVFRIPYGKTSKTQAPNSKPVYVQHGLLSSSDDWILARPEKGLGYILADAGYDVWLGNSRGNKWSRRHVSLNPDKAKYWDFSWHEMGIYDLPAVIDHILKMTGVEQTFYVGHSMGTTMFYVMGAMRPEYNAKIRAAFTLAPVAFMGNTKTPLLKAISNAADPLGVSHTVVPAAGNTWCSGQITRLPSLGPGLKCRPIHLEFVVEKNGLADGFHAVLSFPLPFIPPFLHYHIKPPSS